MNESDSRAGELARLFEESLSRYQAALAEATSESALRVVHARYAGKEGEIRKRLADALKAAPGPDKRAVGQAGNTALQKAEELFGSRLVDLHEQKRQADLQRRLDVTIPGRPHRLGGLHLLTQVRLELEGIFAELGFQVATGPQVETDFHNFEALAMPKDHPARDMQDTFYLRSHDPSHDPLVLRTHTSPVQIRTMLQQKPPVRIISPGKVYRKDDDPTHSPMFQQIEGLCVDEGVTMADLKGTLLYFVQRFFGPGIGLRLRPSFFPFTEPSAEVDIECFFCKRSGCRTCKGSGYIEILGCGMVDPEVFRHVGYDSEKYSGFAFGTGLERMTMLRYGISDLRLFFAGDARFTEQFR
ncbi:MAG: phenylalanine--tRNA ligase subunit alpha [Myxococcales bacterium]|nr:phenylalanine--tRNA ligase subunit alpha [Myxococcales bacterium]